MEQLNFKRLNEYSEISLSIFCSYSFHEEISYMNFRNLYWEEKLYISRYGSIEY